MFERVIQRFLEGQKDIVAAIRSQRVGGQAGGQVEFAVDGRAMEIFGGVLTQISGQPFERVMSRIDGPYDIVKFFKKFARGQGNGVDLLFELKTSGSCSAAVTSPTHRQNARTPAIQEARAANATRE